jgi:uncharacterized membrane protein YeaQ/YmgE (transglycosylase-associated protein family)
MDESYDDPTTSASDPQKAERRSPKSNPLPRDGAAGHDLSCSFTAREAEHMLGLIISIIVIGLIAGALARLIVPGKQSMGIGMTILLGIVGSFVGGFLGFLLFGADAQDGFFQPAGIIGSLIGAIVVLLIWGAVPGRRARRS